MSVYVRKEIPTPQITFANLSLLIGSIIFILIAIRSAKDMSNRKLIHSESLFRLLIRLIHRHWMISIEIGLVLIMLVVVLKFVGVITAALILTAIIMKNQRRVIKHQRHVGYIRSIWPDHTHDYLPVKLNYRGGVRLGGQDINYVFLNHRNKKLTFPESGTKHHSYYLLNIRFKPKFGPRYNRLTYRRPFSIKSYGSMDHRSNNIVEIPSTAVVKLISTDLSRVTEIHLHNEISNVVDHLRYFYVLNYYDKRDLGLV